MACYKENLYVETCCNKMSAKYGNMKGTVPIEELLSLELNASGSITNADLSECHPLILSVP